MARVVARFARLRDPRGCGSLGTDGFKSFCTAFVSWRYHPADFAGVTRTTIDPAGIGHAIAAYRRGTSIGFNLIRADGGSWKIDSEQTGAQAGQQGTVTRGSGRRDRTVR
jgi:hypothetical protein